MKDIKCIITWLFTLILVTPVLLLSLLLKLFVCVCAKMFRKELVPLNPMDYIVVGLLGKDFYPPMADNFNIGFTCKLQGNVDSEIFFQNFRNNVIKCPIETENNLHNRFHQNIERFWGYWFFKTFEDIFYHNHVTCCALDEKSTLQDEISTWLKIRYRTDCPMWGVLFLFNDKADETHFAFKIHHVLADGYTLMHILDLMTDTSYNYQVKEFQDSKLTKLMILKEAAYNLFQYTRRLYQMPRSYVYAANGMDNCKKIGSDKLFLAFTSFPLSVIQNIRRKADVNFASVMMCLINGCVKDLLGKHVEKNCIGKLPEHNVISNTLAWPKHPRCDMCNHFTAGLFKFDLQGNSSKSLNSVDEEFKEFHKRHLHRIIRGFWELLAIFPDCIMSSPLVHNGIIDRVTTSYVHLTGSRHYNTVMGINCKDVCMFCILPSKIDQIVVTCLTTSDEVRVIVAGINSIFPTQQDADYFFQKSFQKNLEELSSEWLGK